MTEAGKTAKASGRRVSAPRCGRPPLDRAGEVEARILDAATKVFLERGFERRLRRSDRGDRAFRQAHDLRALPEQGGAVRRRHSPQDRLQECAREQPQGDGRNHRGASRRHRRDAGE